MDPITPLRIPCLVRLHRLLLLILALVAYANSFHGPFIFDDLTWIERNESIRRLWPPGPVLTETPRPAVNLSFAVNYALGGSNVFGYHLTNLAIHLASALVLYGIVRRTIPRAGGTAPEAGSAPAPSAASATSAASHAAWFAAATAAIWLVHPLQTQSVTYLVQRSESLMGLFYLSCLYCVMRGAASPRRALWHAGAIACCWIGMTTKEVMATAPIVVLIYDRVFLAAGWKSILRQRWGLYLGLLSSWCWLLQSAAPTLTAETGSAGFNAPVISPVEYLMTQSGVLLHYLKLVLWPSPLCLDYYWPIARSGSVIIVPGLVIIGLLLASLAALRRRPALGFLGLSVFLILAPTSSIVPIADLAVEHRMYLPLASLIVLILLGSWTLVIRFGERYRIAPGARARIALGAVVGALTCCTALTIDRNHDYRSAESIWQSVLEVNPDNPRAFNELGRAFHEKNHRAEAYRCYRMAVALSDSSDMKPLAPFHYNLASSLHDQGLREEAIHHYRRALHLQPRSTQVLLNLGAALGETGDLEGAIDCYRKALAIRPGYSLAHNNLALALERHGQDEEAVRSFERALEGEPKIAAIRLNMARALTRLGRLREAVDLYIRFAEESSRDGDPARAAAGIATALQLAADLGDTRLLARLNELEARYSRARGPAAR